MVIYGMTKDKAQNSGYIRSRGRKRAVLKCISHTSLRRGGSSSSAAFFPSAILIMPLKCKTNVAIFSKTVLCFSWLEPLECHGKKKSPEDDDERDFRSLCLFSLLRLFLNPKILIKQAQTRLSNVYFSRKSFGISRKCGCSSAKHSKFLRHSLSSRSQTKECWRGRRRRSSRQ